MLLAAYVAEVIDERPVVARPPPFSHPVVIGIGRSGANEDRPTVPEKFPPVIDCIVRLGDEVQVRVPGDHRQLVVEVVANATNALPQRVEARLGRRSFPRPVRFSAPSFHPISVASARVGGERLRAHSLFAERRRMCAWQIGT